MTGYRNDDETPAEGISRLLGQTTDQALTEQLTGRELRRAAQAAGRRDVQGEGDRFGRESPHLFNGPVPPPLRHAPARTVPGRTVVPTAPARRAQGPSLRVDWPACKGHGLCAELLPERFGLDEWGYPVVDPSPVPADLVEVAKRAVASCPTLALRLVDPPGR